VEVVHPPRDSRPVEACPQPSFFGKFHPPILILPSTERPGPENLDSLELDR
jgi:hypothetical protein